jgi:hypothetical protein
MMKLGWLYSVSLATILAGVPARAAAQWGWMNDTLEKRLNHSHLLDPDRFGLPSGSTEELFQQRLKSIRTKEIETLRNKYVQTPGQLDQLLSKNPELVQKFLKNFKMDDLPAELRSKFAGKEGEFEKFIRSMTLRDFLRAAESLKLSPNTGDAPGGPGSPTPPPPPSDQSIPPSESGAASNGADTAHDSGASETNAETSSPNSAWGRWLLEAADRFKDLDPALRSSPALRRAIRDLSRKIDGVDEQWQQLDKGANALAEKWASLGQALPLHRLWPENGFSWPRGLTPQSLPNWHWPESSPGLRPSTAPSLPQVVPILQSDGWRSLGMVLILAVLGLFVWKVMKGSLGADSPQRIRVWKLGPWPVDPSGVRTREELIRAFEYLSLLRLGPAARHQNHRAIAFSLGASESGPVNGWGDPLAERHQAAKELASLYEQARYAPPGDVLSQAALDRARRDLCLLAGVANS